MRYLLLLLSSALFVASCLCGRAAEPAPMPPQQTGRLLMVRLFAVERVAAKAPAPSPTAGEAAVDASAPDGLAFYFLVTRKPGAGRLFLKETRDFKIAGESYQEKTRRELKRTFEPRTEVTDAAKFFAANPRLSPHAPNDPKGVLVISIAIGGAKLSAAETAEVIGHFGLGNETEAFFFSVPVPEPVATPALTP